MSQLLREGVIRLHKTASLWDAGAGNTDPASRDLQACVQCLAELVGTEGEAESAFGDDTDFWADRCPREVSDAMRRLPVSLAEARWHDALCEAVTVRALHLIRITACLSKSDEYSSFPPHPVPMACMPPPASPSDRLGVHAEVFTDANTSWSEFALCIAVESTCTVTLLRPSAKLTSGVVSTHPFLKQRQVAPGKIEVTTPHRVHVLVSGRVRDTGHTTLRIAERCLPRYGPAGKAGRSVLQSYVSHALLLRKEEVEVEHGGGALATVSFPNSGEPDKLQARLLAHRTEVWEERWESAAGEPDARIEFPSRPAVNLALSGRSGVSAGVADEVLRQRIARILLRQQAAGGASSGATAAWQRELVSAVMEQGGRSAFCDEVLWCAAAGSVDVSDSNEFGSLVESCAREMHVANVRPMSPLPHKRHRLFDTAQQHPLRIAALALNAALLRALPLVDPATAQNLGAVSPPSLG